MKPRYYIPTTIEWQYLEQILNKSKTSEFKGASEHWVSRLEHLVGKHDGDLGISFVNPKVSEDYPEKSYKFDVVEIIRWEKKMGIARKEYDAYYEIKLGRQLDKDGKEIMCDYCEMEGR